jgi:hypothetical protein
LVGQMTMPNATATGSGGIALHLQSGRTRPALPEQQR